MYSRLKPPPLETLRNTAPELRVHRVKNPYARTLTLELTRSNPSARTQKKQSLLIIKYTIFASITTSYKVVLTKNQVFSKGVII